MVTSTFTLDKETQKILDKLSKDYGIPKSAIVRAAIRLYAISNARNVGDLLILKELADIHYDIYMMFQVLLAMNPNYCNLDVIKRMEIALSDKAKEYLKLSKILEKVLSR